MGELDSSKTRVAPVFCRLLMRDPTGEAWLPRLLALPRRFDNGRIDIPEDPGRLVAQAWYPEERRLPPPVALLRTLVANPELLDRDALAASSDDVRAKRELLIGGDPEARAEALALLEQGLPDRAWFVFEGPTSVDVYLETPKVVVLIEGKRTEPGPTVHTRWMRVRHQMLRNLDAARSGMNKQVCGFFIVEAPPGSTEVGDDWREFAIATVSPEALTGSLPHRSPEEQDGIAATFLGVTTWQAVCRELGIPYHALPDRIVSTRQEAKQR